MHIVQSIAELRRVIATSDQIAFVPTMGNLHEGHLHLVRQAQLRGMATVVSIFVNRLQFLPQEDFDSYPRTFAADCSKLEEAGVHIVFAPQEADMYPEQQTVKVQADPALADILEGHFRPGFFTGVSTVVLKLFMAVFAGKPGGVAIFGKKDYQQWMVIRQLVRQFVLPIEIVGVDTCRAEDGLALSSRNTYLSPSERLEAVQLSRALRELGRAARAVVDLPKPQSEKLADLKALEEHAMQTLRGRDWHPDYLTVRRCLDLQPPLPLSGNVGAAQEQELVVLGAARLGKTRLIDNFEI